MGETTHMQIHTPTEDCCHLRLCEAREDSTLICFGPLKREIHWERKWGKEWRARRGGAAVTVKTGGKCKDRQMREETKWQKNSVFLAAERFVGCVKKKLIYSAAVQFGLEFLIYLTAFVECLCKKNPFCLIFLRISFTKHFKISKDKIFTFKISMLNHNSPLLKDTKETISKRNIFF